MTYWWIPVFLQTLLSALKYEPERVNFLLHYLTTFEQEYVFMNRTVKEILWGYQDPALHMAKRLAPDWFYTDIAGYFINVSKGKALDVSKPKETPAFTSFVFISIITSNS